MEKVGRKVLHERSNSRNNMDLQLLGRGSYDGQVSDKDYQGASSVSARDLPTPTKGKGVATKPWTPTRTSGTSTPRSAANSSISLGSIGSLPPIPPLQINKIPPLSIKKLKKKNALPPLPPRSKGLEQFFYPLAQERRPSLYIDSATRSASNSSADTIHSLVDPRPQPNQVKPILKKPSALGPDSVEDYEEKRSSWREHNQNQAVVYARMNGRSLRIVRGEGDGGEDVAEQSQVGPIRQASPTIQPPRTPTPPEPIHIPPSPSKQPQSNHRSNSLLRTGSFLRPSSSKGIPSWARYFYSRGEAVLEMAGDEEEGQAGFSNRNGPLSGSDSVAIRPLTPAHLAPPTLQQPRTSRDDPEVITQWSYPHLDRSTYPVSPTEDLKNRHIIMFCLGFLLPFCWLIGAFLPLPGPTPQWTNGRKSATGEEFERLENCSPKHLRKYRNSQYWRRVNRYLAPVGLLLIGAIIALGIVASRIS